MIPTPPIRTFGGVAAALAIACVAVPCVQAAVEARDDGIVLGPWIVAPWYESAWGYDDNVFRSSVVPTSDSLRRHAIGAVATLPFRSSSLELDYSYDRRRYDTLTFQREAAQELGAELDLRFGSGDRLRLAERYTLGIFDLQQFNEGGELVFRGEPYDYNRIDVELSRSVPRRRGYLARVTRYDLEFDTDDPVPYFDYSGLEAAVELREPLPADRWLVVYADVRRFNNFEVDQPGGDPYRREESGSLQVGVRGVLGGRTPFSVRLGYGRLDYSIIEAEGYSGLVGNADISFDLGMRSRLVVRAYRRPISSTTSTYFLTQHGRVDFQWDLRRTVRFELGSGLWRNSYPEPLAIGICAGLDRNDDRLDTSAAIVWQVHPRLGIQGNVTHTQRTSNCSVIDYDADLASVGLRLGW